MQQIKLHKIFNRVKRGLDNNYSQEVYDRENKLIQWQKLVSEGCDINLICELLKVSRATLFRWKKSYELYGIEGLQNESRKPNKVRKSIKQKELLAPIFALRRKYPIFGKDKLKIMLKEECGIDASVSTIGYILTDLKKQRKISSVSDLCGKKIPRKQRRFEGYAQRYDFQKPKLPGDMLQIDHMVEGNYKHFASICPITKLWFSQIYTSATSATGAAFLKELILFYPFKINSIQVDGGCEFMADFEDLCMKLGIKLYVLPPRSPKLNAFVERSNNTAHYEFYALNPHIKSIETFKLKLAQFVLFYNEKRPHQHLSYLTPMRYFNNWKEQASGVSFV